MNKKLLTALCTALVLAVSVYAQTAADFNVTLTEDGKGAVITGYTGTVAAVRIPATIQGMPVREIGREAFSGSYIVTSVVIPVGVTRIGYEAFGSCRKLMSVTIPEGVIEIGNAAFSDCPLTAVTLPKSLKTLGEIAFSYAKISAVTIPAVTDVGRAAFSHCENLRTVTLSEGMEEISSQMFENCTALTAIALPASIKEIGELAFGWCTNLAAVTIPDSVETIEFSYDSFQGCSKLSLSSQAALKKRGYTGIFSR
jgi:hypothetical protein